MSIAKAGEMPREVDTFLFLLLVLVSSILCQRLRYPAQGKLQPFAAAHSQATGRHRRPAGRRRFWPSCPATTMETRTDHDICLLPPEKEPHPNKNVSSSILSFYLSIYLGQNNEQAKSPTISHVNTTGIALINRRSSVRDSQWEYTYTYIPANSNPTLRRVRRRRRRDPTVPPHERA